MKMVPAIQLEVGMVTGHEYFSSAGELLIAKGITVTEKQLDVLRRRNIFELFIRDAQPDDELSKILDMELRRLDDLEFAENPTEPRAPAQPAFIVPDALRGIAAGQEGIDQLMSSPLVLQLDKKVERSLAADRPDGPPFNSVLTQISVAQRDDAYKAGIEFSYQTALTEVRQLLTSLAQGNTIDGTHVEQIIARFTKTFVTDRNILLNLSGVKSQEEDFLFNHCLNVCLLSLNIAASAGYSKRQTIEVGMAALLHDVGMMLVPPEIRFKKGRLTPDELYEVQKHPITGLHLLERITRLPASAAIVAYQSHERSNGSGYPRRRKDHLIHRFAKMVQCADIFEAVSSPRSYREAMAPYKGMEMLIKMARQGFLSTDYVRAFLSYMSLFPVGSIVELNDHRIAKVTAPNPESFAKPQVSILLDVNGRRLAEHEIYQINLATPENEAVQVVRSHRFDFMNDLGVMQGF